MPIRWDQTEPAIDFWEEQGEYHLDVRRFLAEGGRPYPYIMGCVRQIARGDVLVLHAPFEPRPLTVHVARLKLDWRSEREGEDHWTLRIWK